MEIRLMRDSAYAPCAYLVVRQNADGAWDTRDESNTVLVQLDWDFPSLARDFGWDFRAGHCTHSGTDGTVNCPDCGKTAAAFIAEAGAWLADNADSAIFASDPDGMVIEDTGYFGGSLS